MTVFVPHPPSAINEIRPVVGVIIRDAAGRILLERRSDCGLWGLPGGRLDPGESVADAALREVFEETGLRVRLGRLVGVYSGPDQLVTYPGNIVQLVDIIFDAEVLSGVLCMSPESLELRFFEVSDLPAELVPPAVSPLRDYATGGCGFVR